MASPPQTPALILDVLTTLPRNSFAPGRAVENVFREINESFLKLDDPRFVCECSDASCSEPIVVSVEIMRRLHEDRNLYVLRPAHINTDLEQLVESDPAFAIVRKPALS
jgi:hypothetical protein